MLIIVASQFCFASRVPSSPFFIFFQSSEYTFFLLVFYSLIHHPRPVLLVDHLPADRYRISVVTHLR